MPDGAGSKAIADQTIPPSRRYNENLNQTMSHYYAFLLFHDVEELLPLLLSNQREWSHRHWGRPLVFAANQKSKKPDSTSKLVLF
jgi:hypothetical protein